MSISIISPTGRALQVKLEQAAQQGANPEQVMQMLNQNVGMVSFPELLALKSQYDAIKNSQPPAAPPKDTVVNDMAREVNARGAGVPSLPVSNVGNPSAYAGGGIVSFQSGGPAFTPAMMGTPSEAAYVMDYVEQLKNTGAITAEEAAAIKTPGGNPGFKAKALAKAKAGLSKLNPNITMKGMGAFATRAAPFASIAALGTGAIEAKRTLSEINMEDGNLNVPNAVPIEALGSYYKGAFDKPYTGGEFGKDIGLRSLAMLQHMGTLGMTGPIAAYRDSQKTNAPTAAAAGKPGEPGMDISQFFGRDGAASGLAGLEQAGRINMPARPDLNREAPKELNIQDEIARRQKLDEEYGVLKSYQEQQAQLAKEKKDLVKEGRQDKWNALADGFFRMAQAASQPGATFLGAASEGAVEGSKQYKSTIKDLRASEKALNREQFAVAQAMASRTGANITAADAAVEASKKRIDEENRHQDNILMNLYQVDANVAIAEASRMTQLAIAKITSSNDRKMFEDTYINIMQSGLSKDKKMEAITELLSQAKKYFESTLGGVLAAAEKNNINFTPPGIASPAGDFKYLGPES